MRDDSVKMEEQIEQVEEVKKSNPIMQWIIAIIASTTIFQYGLSVGWASVVFKDFQSENSPAGYKLSDQELSWVASVICITAVLGGPLFAYIVDRFGRKFVLICVAILQATGWTIKLCSSVTISLVIARLFIGGAAAGVYTSLSMYIKEISEDRIRGTLGSFFTLSMFTGTFVMFILGTYLDYYTVLYVVLTLSILTLVMLLKVPESPAFLVKKGKVEEAASTLAFLRRLDVNDKVIQNEIDFMKNEELAYKSLPKVSYISIIKNRPWRYGFLLCVCLMTLAMNSGNFAILTYGTTILKAAGTTMDPNLQLISFPAISMTGSIISMNCVDRMGRKPIAISTFLLASSALAVLATSIKIIENGGTIPSVVPLFSIWCYLFAYAGGIQAMLMILVAEMFNFQIRAKIVGFIMTYGWLMSFIHIKSYEPLSRTIGNSAVFYVYTAINLIGVLVSVFFVHETKGKTVEQIEKELSKKGMN